MFGHRAKPKKFDLPLRYYDPKEDEKRRRRISFRSDLKRNRYRRQNIQIIIYAFGLAIVVWIITIL
ncbi:MAG: hypothetical protein WD513_06405 [Balneolaceae bacterium]